MAELLVALKVVKTVARMVEKSAECWVAWKAGSLAVMLVVRLVERKVEHSVDHLADW